jgi:transcriptional regulator with XRE-family HTH domain
MRTKYGWSQSELAAAMEVDHQIYMSQSHISAIERHERGVKDYELDAFGKVLSVSLEWLVRG